MKEMTVDELIVEWVAHPDARRRIQAEVEQLHTENAELRRIRGTARRMIDHRDEKLAAAQAAIQRVRAVCDGAEKRAHDMVGIFSGKKGAEVPAWVGRVRRALDGDTTEEVRGA